MAEIAVIGCGHVGLVTAACFADLGHSVLGIDIDAGRVAALRAGRCPIYEPGLDDLLRGGLQSGRLSFREGYPQRLTAEFVFIAVNTPSSRDGAADLRAVRDAISSLAPRLQADAIIVNKSTVPIGTGELVDGMARRAGAAAFSVVSNPEFLQEGSAIDNFMSPDRVVLGSTDPEAIERVAVLYEPLDAPLQRTDIRTAEMIKYASNSFLATKISFINEMAAICEAVGADVSEVATGMGADPRIGAAFLGAGLGWGGSCFPKDVQSLAHVAAVHGTHPQLLRSVKEINDDQRRRTVQKIRLAIGELERRRVLVLGAAFKPHTDDVRHSPALELAELLQLEGAEVTVYDPVAKASRITAEAPSIAVAGDLLEGARGADAVVLGTEWPQFRSMPLERLAAAMARPLLVDTRNFLDPRRVRAAGFDYRAVGRPGVEGRDGAAGRDGAVIAAMERPR